MKISVLLVIFLSVRSYASEAEFNCHDIAIAPDGMAWDLNAQGLLITGTVVCESKTTRSQVQYKDGFKHGKEYITFTKNRGEFINTYSKGEKIMKCQKIFMSKDTMTICENIKTGEKTTTHE